MINPSPYMAYFDFGSWFLIGSSPEVMVKAERKKNKQIVASLRPIAGTRPRGSDVDEDSLFETDLLNDPKEISEHVMLVDLGRNDLGRVCQIGSVQLTDLMSIEKYPLKNIVTISALALAFSLYLSLGFFINSFRVCE
mgnify:CR=1 FL=1